MKPATVRMPSAAAGGDEGLLAVLVDRLPAIVPQRGIAGRLDAEGDARQPGTLQQPQQSPAAKARCGFRWRTAPARSRRSRQAADLVDELQRAVAAEAEERIAELERAKTPAADALAHLLGDRPRIAEARGVFQHQVRAVVALEAAAAARLDQPRGKPPEIVADAESLAGPAATSRAAAARSRSSVTPSCTVAPGLCRALRPAARQLLGLALHDRHAQVRELLAATCWPPCRPPARGPAALRPTAARSLPVPGPA